jgi:hypothetical protein
MKENKEREKKLATEIIGFRLLQRFTIDIDSALYVLHCTDAGSAATLQRYLPPPSSGPRKMEALCTSEMYATLLTSSRCKYPRADPASSRKKKKQICW